MKSAEYEMKAMLTVRSPWRVCYHPGKDELFLYYVDQDEVAWIFWRGGLDSAGFPEFMNFDGVEWLGEL